MTENAFLVLKNISFDDVDGSYLLYLRKTLHFVCLIILNYPNDIFSCIFNYYVFLNDILCFALIIFFYNYYFFSTLSKCVQAMVTTAKSSPLHRPLNYSANSKIYVKISTLRFTPPNNGSVSRVLVNVHRQPIIVSRLNFFCFYWKPLAIPLSILLLLSSVPKNVLENENIDICVLNFFSVKR